MSPPIPAARLPSVLFVATFPPPYTGQTVATERFYDLVRGAVRLDRLDFVDPGRHARASGVFSLRRAAAIVGVVGRLRRRLRRQSVDVLYVVPSASALGHLRDRALVWAARPFARRIVGHVHNGNWSGLFEGRLARSAARLVRDLDVVCFLSESLARRAAGRVPPAKTAVVPNTPAPDLLFSDAEVDARIARRSRRETLRVAFVGNMAPSKGYAVLGDALAVLRARGVAVEADFVGGWPSREARATFERSLREAGLAGSVRVHGAVEDRAVLRAVLADADALVLPTTYPHEAQPLSIIEALNAGVPVVATPHAAIPDMIADGESGFLVDPTPDAVADALAALVDVDRWAHTARAARRAYERQFAAGVVRQKLLAALVGQDSREPSVEGER